MLTSCFNVAVKSTAVKVTFHNLSNRPQGSLIDDPLSFNCLMVTAVLCENPLISDK